jgi:hypothetical protein
MAKGPELQRAAVPMQIAADDGNDLTAADADSYRSPMAGAINSYRLEDFAESKPCLNAASGDDSPLPGPAAIVAAASMLPVPDIPGILYARSAGTGAARHHALFEGGEGAGQAVVATAAAVLHAPGPVDFGGSRAGIDGSKGCDRKRGESGADHHHGYPPDMGRLPIEHPAGPFLPVVERRTYNVRDYFRHFRCRSHEPA